MSAAGGVVRSDMTVFRENVQFLLEFYDRRQYQLAAYLEVERSHLSHFLNWRASDDHQPSAAVRKKQRRSDARWLSASKFDGIAAYFEVELWMLFRGDLPEMIDPAQVDRRQRG